MSTVLDALAILGAACLLCCAGLVLFFAGASKVPTPTPDANPGQVLWLKHSAKVAHRRAS